MQDPEVFDYGDSDVSDPWKDFLEKHVKNSEGWILVTIQSEDHCYYIRRGTEAQIKKEYMESQEEWESHDEDLVFHDGREVKIVKTVQFVGIEEEVDKIG